MKASLMFLDLALRSAALSLQQKMQMEAVVCGFTRLLSANAQQHTLVAHQRQVAQSGYILHVNFECCSTCCASQVSAHRECWQVQEEAMVHWYDSLTRPKQAIPVLDEAQSVACSSGSVVHVY